MPKNIILIVILAIVIIILGGILLWPTQKTLAPQDDNQPVKGIHVSSPVQGATVYSPLKISGFTDGGGWIGFEGQVGIVKLFDDSGNELGMAILTAKGEWMKEVIDFETMLWFDYPGDGKGKLVFYNENPSGEPERSKTYEMAVKLVKSSSEKTTVNVYFSNSQMDPEFSCNKVFSIARDVPKTDTPARVALEELLKGPTDTEKLAQFSTNINSGVSIKSLVISNGVAKVDFSQELQQGVGGSCRVSAIRAQITETLKQFPTVSSVIISINGETEDILQP